MTTTALNYLSNLPRLLRGDGLFRPLVVSYSITHHCNLNCAYCEDFGARRNPSQTPPLTLPEAQQVLTLLRAATDALIITGGEPLLYPALPALLQTARRDLRFRSVTLLTNGLLLAERADAVLPHLTRLVISLDAVDPALWEATLRAESGAAQTILATITATARRQRESGFRLIVHCVVTPETLPQARAVLDFCAAHDILFSFSPQSTHNWPRYELLVSDDYRAFVAHVLAQKQRGAPVLGSRAYLRMMLTFEPYACYPLLAPRVMPDGTLAYPCRPIERSGTEQGGRAIHLLAAGSWQAAVRQAVDYYGQPPSTCGSCYQQCYVEPSLLQARPLALLAELVRFPAARQGELLTYAPG